jgi:hypothetical protein
MARISKAIDRAFDNLQRDIEAKTRPSPVAPGLDREGMPPLSGVVGSLAELEEQSRRRFSPRRNRWGDVRAFDDRVAEYERRRGEIGERLEPLQHQLAHADQTDADGIAAWLAGGEKGPRPQSVKPRLEQEIADLRLESDGLIRASSDELARKAEYVERHRDRLVKDARRHVGQAHAALVAKLKSLPVAREELVAAREAELWALTYGHEHANQMPAFAALAGGNAKVGTKLGLTQSTPVERLFEALRSDADWLTEAISPPQREIVDGEAAKPGAAMWVGSPEHEATLRAEREAYREAYKRAWGTYPDV